MAWSEIIGRIASRIPIERILLPPHDNTQALENFLAGLSGLNASTFEDKTPIVKQDKTPIVKEESSEQKPFAEPKMATRHETIATACIPCAMGHYGTCSGLLNEAMRFAKKEGISSEEVIDRVNMCMDELNAMERVDLRPELTAYLSVWEKELANSALTDSRSLRHALESLRNVDDLETVAATTQTARNKLGREWFKQRLNQPGETKPMSLSEAKTMAAEEAAKEVEKRWSQKR